MFLMVAGFGLVGYCARRR
ncbi:hypothetical protein [Glacieibacterium megasporae]|nr:hypothetical protein KZX46_02550 [Polymorphobacter sp. PAMC 29334]UAJ12927.1 hypothetical protein KTC28_20835 [Polymorphobacter megasporae]